MPLKKFYNLVRMYTTTTGDSDVTLTTAVPGCKTFADAGVSDSEEVHYGLITYDLGTHRPTKSETGLGKYISSGTVFQRTTVENSTDSDNSTIDLTGLSEIYITPPASRLNGFSGPYAVYAGSSDAAVLSSSDATLPLNTEYADEFGLGTLASDILTFAWEGYYEVKAAVAVTGTITANGTFRLNLINTGSSYNTDSQYPVISGKNLSGNHFDVSGTIYMNVGNTLTVKLFNDCSNTLNAYIESLVIQRLGQ